MKYIFRGEIVFEYFPEKKRDKVMLHKREMGLDAYNFCSFIDEDYKFLAQYFDTVYRHTQGEEVELKDIEVN